MFSRTSSQSRGDCMDRRLEWSLADENTRVIAILTLVATTTMITSNQHNTPRNGRIHHHHLVAACPSATMMTIDPIMNQNTAVQCQNIRGTYPALFCVQYDTGLTRTFWQGTSSWSSFVRLFWMGRPMRILHGSNKHRKNLDGLLDWPCNRN